MLITLELCHKRPWTHKLPKPAPLQVFISSMPHGSIVGLGLFLEYEYTGNHSKHINVMTAQRPVFRHRKNLHMRQRFGGVIVVMEAMGDWGGVRDNYTKFHRSSQYKNTILLQNKQNLMVTHCMLFNINYQRIMSWSWLVHCAKSCFTHKLHLICSLFTNYSFYCLRQTAKAMF